MPYNSRQHTMENILSKLTGGGGRKIPSLDGLRAISIALVILAHLGGTRNFPFATDSGRFDLNLGVLGVRVFFVISGFLITGLLLEEKAKTGAISLKYFYLRRTFRIFPPFYVFLAVVLALTLTALLTIPLSEFVYAATYTMNFVMNRGWYLGHLWSLAVEEQFYLLWPFLLVSLGVPMAMRWALAVVVLSPLVRIGVTYLFPSQMAGIGSTFYTIADPLAVGCCLSGFARELSGNRRYQGLLQSNWMPVIAASIFVVNALPGTKLNFLIFQSYLNIAIALCLESVVRYPRTAVGRLLNLAPLRAIGVLSYSLYLWQQLFINRTGSFWWNAFPANLLLACVCALASFFLVETPALELRKRLERGMRGQSAVPARTSSAA